MGPVTAYAVIHTNKYVPHPMRTMSYPHPLVSRETWEKEVRFLDGGYIYVESLNVLIYSLNVGKADAAI